MNNESSPTIPRKQISILAGASGAGKTTLLLQAIASWAKGSILFPEFTWDGEKGVAYIVSDRTCDELNSRVATLDIPSDKIEVYSVLDDLKVKEVELLAPKLLLTRILNERLKQPFDLLVLDPLAVFMTGNPNNYQHAAASLFWLNRIAIERNITIIALHHATKARSDFKFRRPQDRISGSSALLGFSGSQIVMAPAAEDATEYDTLYITPHTMPPMMIELERGQDGYFHRAPEVKSPFRRLGQNR